MSEPWTTEIEPDWTLLDKDQLIAKCEWLWDRCQVMEELASNSEGNTELLSNRVYDLEQEVLELERKLEGDDDDEEDDYRRMVTR
jgi:hypothetical protein